MVTAIVIRVSAPANGPGGSASISLIRARSRGEKALSSGLLSWGLASA